MKTKIVYVLVSTDEDYYYEMLLLSLYSLRLYHPKKDAEVVLVMDADTNLRLISMNSPIFADITPLVKDIPPEFTVIQRSRYLKTQLRQIVGGDFLYLDCDTLVCEPMNEIDSMSAAVGMVSDENDISITADKKELCMRAGFIVAGNNQYYNSGVMYVKDTKAAYELFLKWHECWLQSLQNGVNQDQPALNYVNESIIYSTIDAIEGIWNCQIYSPKGLEFLPTAKIVHYFAHTNSILRSSLFSHIKNNQGLESISERIAKAPKTIGFTTFTARDSRVYDYLFSDDFYYYDAAPSIYKKSMVITKLLFKVARLLRI